MYRHTGILLLLAVTITLASCACLVNPDKQGDDVFATIQDAIDQCKDSEIVVEAGFYEEDLEITHSVSLATPNGAVIVGNLLVTKSAESFELRNFNLVQNDRNNAAVTVESGCSPINLTIVNNTCAADGVAVRIKNDSC